MTLTTVTELSAPVNVVFQKKFLKDARQRCPYFIGSRPGDVLQSHNGSFSVRWRRYDNMTPTTTALTALTGSETYPTRTASQASKTDIDATVSKYGDHIILNEEADLINFNGQTAELVEVMAVQAGRSLNRLQRNTLEDNVTLVYADGATTDGGVSSPISLTLIRSAVNALARQSAMKFMPATGGSSLEGTSPMRESYWGLCHVDVEEDIRDIAGFIPVERYMTQTRVESGEFGAVGGVRWISTEEASADADLGDTAGNTVRSTTGVSADLYTSIILGMNAHGALSLDADLVRRIYKAGDPIPGIIMIQKGKGSAGTADPLNELATIGWKSWHAGALIGPSTSNSGWARGLRTAARKLT
ncbi:MAG: N4-gp56 family major capsid protein [Rhodospirillaceae bacterium]